MTERLDAAVAPLGVAAGRRPRPDLPRARARDPARRRRRRRAARRSRRRCCADGRALGRRGRPASARHRGLAAQGRARRHGRGRRGRPGRRARRPGVRRVRGGRRGERRPRLRRPHPARDRRARSATPRLLARWRGRCRELLVDEVQDVDRAQLRLALLLAAPANRIFLVGDDDQSIYGWRLADVRRILGLDGPLPGLRRVDLEVNYRCPRQVVERAVRLVEHNGERFAKRIRAGPAADRAARPRPGPVRRDRPPRACDADVAGRRLDPGGPGPDEPRAAPGRRRRARGSACRSGRRGSSCSLDSPLVDDLLARAGEASRHRRAVCSSRSGASGPRAPMTAPPRPIATALLGWAVGHARSRGASRRPSRRPAPLSPTCAATTRR